MIKIAIALRILLSRNKNSANTSESDFDIISSYEKISLNSSSDLTKLTVTNAFSGKKRSAMTTVIIIVETMGYKMSDFSEVYDKITDEDIAEFRSTILDKES